MVGAKVEPAGLVMRDRFVYGFPMLPPDQIRPFLMHSEPAVRMFALGYFEDAFGNAPLSSDDLWPVYDRYPYQEADSILVSMKGMSHSDASARRLLADLRTTNHARWHRVFRAVERLPLPQVARLWPHVKAAVSAGALPAATHETWENMLPLLDEDPKSLWLMLVEICEDFDTMGHLEGDPTPEADAVSDVLILKQEYWPAQVEALLRENKENGWIELFAAQLAGHLKTDGVVGLLSERLGSEGFSSINSVAATALARIGSGAVRDMLVEHYPNAPDDYRLHAAQVLGSIKLAGSEESVRRLLGGEHDGETATILAESLCRLASTEEATLEALRAFAESDLLDPMQYDVAAGTGVLALLNGWSFPEREEWWELALAGEAEREELEIEHALGEVARARIMNGESSNAIDDLFDESVDFGEPAVRDSPKVGRNEPCPCLSGKKYKKCCGAVG